MAAEFTNFQKGIIQGLRNIQTLALWKNYKVFKMPMAEKLFLDFMAVETYNNDFNPFPLSRNNAENILGLGRRQFEALRLKYANSGALHWFSPEKFAITQPDKYSLNIAVYVDILCANVMENPTISQTQAAEAVIMHYKAMANLQQLHAAAPMQNIQERQMFFAIWANSMAGLAPNADIAAFIEEWASISDTDKTKLIYETDPDFKMRRELLKTETTAVNYMNDYARYTNAMHLY